MDVLDPDLTFVAAAAVDMEGPSALDAVILRWDGAGSRSYRVIRATNPRDLSAEEGEIIEGNSWTDPERNGSRVVFYRVEAVEG